MNGPSLLEVQDLTKNFVVSAGIFGRGGMVRAVRGVSFAIARGETLGLVGESGCGKSTIARLVMRLAEPTSGSIRFEGRAIEKLSKRDMRRLRRDLQMVFQDPLTSLDPRFRVGDLVEEPLRVNTRMNKAERRSAAMAMLTKVGLSELHAERRPHELSGGQRQRVGIARALVLSPRFLALDEPLSALDVSIQAQIVGLLADLQKELNLTLLFVSHDLSIVRRMSDRVAVMYLGQIVEIGNAVDIFESPCHPYTRALIDAVPRYDAAHKIGIRNLPLGDPPDPGNPPPGCSFHPRCPLAFDRCRRHEPVLRRTRTGQAAACHLDGPFPVAATT